MMTIASADPMSSGSTGSEETRQRTPLAHGLPGGEEPLRKRRAKTSCIPCRKQKLRCGCEPPSPCTRCRSRKVTCTWPTEDRRTTRFHSVAASQPEVNRQAVDAPTLQNVDPQLRQENFSIASNHDLNRYFTAPQMNSLDNGWLQALFGNDILPALPLGGVDDFDNATIGASGQMNVLDLNIAGSSGLANNDWPTFDDIIAGQSSVRTPRTTSRMVRVRWSRPHGPTAYAPGFHFMGVNIFLQDRPTPAPDGSPAVGVTKPADQFSKETLLGLLEVFAIHFGAQFPCIDVDDFRNQIRRGTGSQFLLYSLCGLAARFSNDPAIALPHLSPSQYGDVFNERARAMVGLVLSVPILETVMGFILLALGINGKGAASELWMISGLASRMALDMGLQIDTTGVDHHDIVRQKRLVFWSVFALDLMVAIGLGRPTTISPSTITQPVPSQDSLTSRNGLTSPFPYFAHVMHCAARINNCLNGQVRSGGGTEEDLEVITSEIMGWYQQLPLEMHWSPRNLALHNAAQQGHCMINVHLWFHTILVLSLSTASNTTRGQDSTAHTIRESADVIREIVDACELLVPTPCLDLPLICQPLYTAAMVYLRALQEDPSSGGQNSSLGSTRLRSHIASLQSTFVQLERYWLGVHSIAAILDQRIRGSVNVDFSDADESRASVDMFPWSLPDKYSSSNDV